MFLLFILTSFLALVSFLRGRAYLKKSIRSSHGASEKSSIGSLSLADLLKGLVIPGYANLSRGILPPEQALYVGWPALVLALFSKEVSLWILLVFCIIMAMGERTPLFKVFSFMTGRIPARFSFLISFCLVMMSLSTLVRLSQLEQAVFFFLEAACLAIFNSQYLPMSPFCQRVEKPSKIYYPHWHEHLSQRIQNYRVTGLPYPLMTGHLHGWRTLGYNGGSQLKEMARLRRDDSVNGLGAHHWFETHAPEDPEGDAYGVKFAFSYRQLPRPWTQTPYRYLWVKEEGPLEQKGFERVLCTSHPLRG